MKLLKLGSLVLGMLWVTLAMVGLTPGVSWGGISGSAHDFSGLGTAPTVSGLCTFCHTPHKAIQTLLLWNHKLSSNTFSWTDAKTTGGTEFPSIPGGTYKGPTTKCLSCHDGSVAVGDLNWFGGTAQFAFGAKGKIAAGDADQIASVTGSMNGNHPVAMPYPYLGAANFYNGKTNGADAVASGWQPTPVAPVRLFNDDGTGSITGGPVATKSGIECSSCHDPHNNVTPVNPYFLRGTLGGNTTDYICLKCHIK